MIAADRETAVIPSYPEWLKRSIDLIGVGILAFFLLIPGLLIALAVMLTSPGPALFRQRRVGRNGETFWLYKFRSMTIGEEGPSVTAKGDSRITPVGRLLRSLKLDELPQLINVLKGDMSLVGPRPEVPEFVALYTDGQRQVLTVRPGITGIAQIEFRHEEKLLANRSDVRSYYIEEIMPRKLELDLKYVEQRSLPLDVKILACTAAALFRR